MTSLDPLLRYFAAEKQGGWLLLALAVVALVVSFLIWRAGWTFRAMAPALSLVALGQFGVGAALVARTDGQVAALTRRLETSAEAARAEEIARIEKVQTSFRWIEIVEVVLLAAGVALALAFRTRPTWSGVGMGLVLQAAVMLVFDLVAEARADRYLTWLRSPPAATAQARSSEAR